MMRSLPGMRASASSLDWMPTAKAEARVLQAMGCDVPLGLRRRAALECRKLCR